MNTPSQSSSPMLRRAFAEVSVRPVRYAFIINRETSPEVVRRVWQYNTSLWGGCHNILVPTDGVDLRADWFRLLLFHDPDVLIFVGEHSQTLLETLHLELQPYNLFQWSDDLVEGISDGSKARKVNALHVSAVLEALSEEKPHLLNQESNIRIISTDGPFAPYIRLYAGEWVPDSKYESFAAHRLGAKSPSYAPQDLDAYLNSIDEIDESLTPLFLSGYYLQNSYPAFGYIAYTLILTDGSMDDLFLFHALSETGPKLNQNRLIVIVPLAFLQTEQEFERLAQWFGSRVTGNTFGIVSYTVPLHVLQNARTRLRKYLPHRNIEFTSRPGWVIHIHRCNLFPTFPNTSHMQQRQLVDVSDRRYIFPVLKPRFLAGLSHNSYVDRKWVLEIDTGRELFNDDGLAPSMFRDLNFVLNGMPKFYISSHIRFARGNLSLLMSARSDIAAFMRPNDRDLIRTACENSGYQVDIDRPLYFPGILKLLGKLSYASFLQESTIMDLLFNSAFRHNEAFVLYDVYKKLKLKPKSEDKQRFQGLVMSLAERQILLRGYMLTCPACGLKKWYAFERVQLEMICDGCRTSFQIPIELEFAYRWNELFQNRGQNQGTITVLLTLLVLSQTARHGFNWEAGVKLTEGSETTEIDVVAMCDGSLVVVECKNSFIPLRKQNERDEEYAQIMAHAIARLKPQLEREIDVARRLNANLFLFATLEDTIPQAIVEFIDAQNKIDERLTVRILSRLELIQGYFNHPDTASSQERHQKPTIHDVVGDSILPPIFNGEDCVSHDESGPFGGVTLF